MSRFFQTVADLFRARQTKKASDFYELARQVANGANIDPAHVASALDEFGKTPDELEQLVNGLQRRADYAQQFATIPGHKARLEQVAAAFRKEEGDFAPIYAAHLAARKQLISEAEYHETQINQAVPLRLKLIETYRGPLTAELDALRQEINATEHSIKSAEDTAKNHEHGTQFADADSAPGTMLSPSVRESKILAAASCRQGAAELKAKLPALQAREAEILEAMLTP